MAKQNEALISRKDAAEILNASEKKIQRLTHTGKLRVIYQKRAAGGQEAFYKVTEVRRVKKALDKGEDPPTILAAAHNNHNNNGDDHPAARNGDLAPASRRRIFSQKLKSAPARKFSENG